ncbi:MAG: D-aminoacylase [Chloroflexi bacterium]|nr:D-aminoacylase [Chloroflexota bacterium]
MFDVVILGGTVVDGSGSPGYRADVGIKGERIEAIGDLSRAETRRVVDARGLTVSPGFIDTHTHSDAVLLTDPQHADGLRQGITTEILGQDGLSYAPLSPENYRANRRYLAGLLGEPPEDLDMSSISAFRSHYHKKVAINTAYPIPHGAVRLECVGFYDRPLVGDALEKARQIIRDGMEQGAVGLSTGMSYLPNAWSTTEELVELCKVVKEFDGVYITHLRDVNTDRAFGDGGVPEALEIGRRSGVKVHFSHYRTMPDSAGKVAERVALIDEAKSEGVDCTLELYPYPTGSSFPIRYLPAETSDGGPDALLKRLRDPGERQRMIEFMQQQSGDIDTAVFTHLPRNRDLEGMSLRDIAGARGVTLEEALFDLLVDEDLQVGYRGAPPDSVAVWRQISRDCVELLSRPDYMVGSDSIHVGSLPHPRAYGCFPRFLGRLRRQFDIMTLEEMVQRMTDNPARRFGLTGRGRIQEGNYADIVVFDADRIIDNATYDDPAQFPAGIPFVLVNGQVAVDNERCTGVMAGQAVP